jgi:hypothetical protein
LPLERHAPFREKEPGEQEGGTSCIPSKTEENVPQIEKKTFTISKLEINSKEFQNFRNLNFLTHSPKGGESPLGMDWTGKQTGNCCEDRQIVTP